MLKIFEWIINRSLDYKFFYVLAPCDTSIGIGSELIRLSLIKAKILDKKVTFIYSRIPFGKFIFNFRYPTQIYNAFSSEAIRREYFLLLMFLEYYYGCKFLFLSLCKTIYLFRRTLYRQHRHGDAWLYAPRENCDERLKGRYSLLKIARAVRNPPKIQISDQINVKCQSGFKKLGLAGRWYVCLHVRTSNFHQDDAVHRNANIKNYYAAIDFIISQGGIVVRMGDKLEDSTVRYSVGFIDYPNTSFKSEIMDLYLIENCRFYFGTQSGIIDTALLLQKPVLSVNSLHFAIPGTGKHNLTIYKNIFDKKRNALLNFENSIAIYDKIISSSHNEFMREFEWIENSSEEIYEAVSEFFKSIDNKNIPSSNMQIYTSRVLKRKAREHNCSNALVYMQAIFSRVIIGSYFLKNWIELP